MMPDFDTLEQEFTWTLVRNQLRTMPREVLEQQAFLAMLNMAQQKAIAAELRDHLEQIRKVLHALG
jgi:hypothetical protein